MFHYHGSEIEEGSTGGGRGERPTEYTTTSSHPTNFQLHPVIFIQLCDSFDNFPCSHDAVIDSRVRLTPSLIYPHD